MGDVRYNQVAEGIRVHCCLASMVMLFLIEAMLHSMCESFYVIVVSSCLQIEKLFADIQAKATNSVFGAESGGCGGVESGIPASAPQSWMEENMAKALHEVIDQTMDYKKVALTHNVPHDGPRKCRRQVGALTSAERGELITAELCFSAAGHYVPPLLVFPRARMKGELLNGAPPGTITACHPSGWMQADIFLQWLEHFIHVRNLRRMNLFFWSAFLLIAHISCSHYMQTWLLNNPGRVITQFQIAGLFGRAYVKVTTMQKAISGFMKTGIYPLNERVRRE
ncbi:hypothetical protein PR048_018480 [Dryococelus australis]|uniref:DDE-1 domain-containing protein n=1 Tax=Dryococelus australis TaxID=614101 RepID=A0ABQ9HCK9_9NEOP|nr:hypothetical protein PR048_018480 [Dryococelus australis]